jgi:hypothetical protein
MMRVYELGRRLNLPSSALLRVLADQGQPAQSASSTVTDTQEAIVRQAIGIGPIGPVSGVVSMLDGPTAPMAQVTSLQPRANEQGLRVLLLSRLIELAERCTVGRWLEIRLQNPIGHTLQWHVSIMCPGGQIRNTNSVKPEIALALALREGGWLTSNELLSIAEEVARVDDAAG